MSFTSVLVSANSISPTVTFAFFFGVTLIIWIFALTRQTILLSVLSMMSWFVLSFSLWTVAETDVAITSGLSIFAALMGIIMTVLSIYWASEYLHAEAEEKKRKMVEDIM